MRLALDIGLGGLALGMELLSLSLSRDGPLLLGPGIGQGFGKAGDGEIRRRDTVDDRRNDAGRQEGEGSEQADVPFALHLTLGDLGERATAAEPERCPAG